MNIDRTVDHVIDDADRRPTKRQFHHGKATDNNTPPPPLPLSGQMAAALVAAAQRQHMVGSINISEIQPMYNSISRHNT